MRAIILILLFATILLGLGLMLDYRDFTQETLPIEGSEILLEVEPGTSLIQLARTMTERGLLDHPYYFLLMAYLSGDQQRIKAGDYAIAPGIRPAGLLARLVAGQVIEYRITLLEGWTFRQALEALDKNPRFAGGLVSPLSDQEVMQRLERPGLHPEGRFFPDTYIFRRTSTRIDLLRRALMRMDQILAEEWDARAEDIPLNTPDEALILASIIEKEAMLAREQPRIAGVFARRLRLGMRLQTDPTVIYGLGERYTGRLSRADLRESTPYNTYVIDGLPPTPIALPGRGAIHAALHPSDGKALFFVARGDGSHAFSETYAEHKRAIRRYILND